jgi:hypothetical protein
MHHIAIIYLNKENGGHSFALFGVKVKQQKCYVKRYVLSPQTALAPLVVSTRLNSAGLCAAPDLEIQHSAPLTGRLNYWSLRSSLVVLI